MRLDAGLHLRTLDVNGHVLLPFDDSAPRRRLHGTDKADGFVKCVLGVVDKIKARNEDVVDPYEEVFALVDTTADGDDGIALGRAFAIGVLHFTTIRLMGGPWRRSTTEDRSMAGRTSALFGKLYCNIPFVCTED